MLPATRLEQHGRNQVRNQAQQRIKCRHCSHDSQITPPTEALKRQSTEQRKFADIQRQEQKNIWPSVVPRLPQG